ncbi:MAG: metal ABC transporter permease [Cryobacterium sp.]|nr:metal ABC transporter permease [Cryobacterium sp.]MBX3089658.1 metal ABC transporter permease [Cryobacterium sp.]MBX3115894.1 metal ABC transporter permease [Cryobacterium sp.]MCO5294930.1 metal ABC transporter permease [Homoserinimonas sp.]
MNPALGVATGFWDQIFDFSDYGELISLVSNTLLAGLALGLMGGLVGIFVMTRDLAFAVHGISELSFAGAAAALLLGASVVVGSITGSLLAAILFGLLGSKARDRNSIVAVLMPFGLGLGILFLALYEGRAANKFGLLIGQIVAVDGPELGWLILVSALAIAGLLAIWRPLTFATADEEVAAARGVPVTLVSVLFMVILGLATAVSVQIVGALLVLALLVTPAAAALRVTSSPVLAPVLSMLFAVVSVVGGTLLALGGSMPISPYITTVSFLIYLACRLLAAPASRRLKSRLNASSAS